MVVTAGRADIAAPERTGKMGHRLPTTLWQRPGPAPKTSVERHVVLEEVYMGMGQNDGTGIWAVLVHVSICQGNPFSIFDNHSHMSPAQKGHGEKACQLPLAYRWHVLAM